MVFQLISQILSLFIIIFSGWIIVYTKILKSSDSKIISKIMLYLINPCVIIGAFQVEKTNKVQKELLFSFMLSVFIHIILFIIIYIFGKLFELNNIEKASIMYSNSVNMIIPIIIALFGQEYIIYCIGFFGFQLILMWTHAKYLVSETKDISLKKVILDINIIAIIIGMLLFIFEIKIPRFIYNPMASIGSMMGTLSMIVSGMLMSELNLEKMKNYTKLPLTIFLKMIVVPLIMVLFIKCIKMYFPIKMEEYIYIITLLATITPTAATITQQCQIYNKDSVYSNAIYVFTTLICIITMPIILFIFI